VNISDRKKKILAAVIDEAANSSEPVSSKQLQENYLSDFSSSLIRSELATLEELGLLYHPHTSSGRLPTVEGIKYYLNEMVPEVKAKASSLISVFDASLDNVSNALKATAKKISEATNYTSIMSISLYDFAIIENVKLLKIDKENALVALITDRGTVRDVISLSMEEGELESLSGMLTDIFKGKTLRQIENSDFIISKEIEKYKYLFECIVLMVAKRDEQENRLAIEGKNKLFDYKEFSSVDKMKSAMNLLYEPNTLEDILIDEDETEDGIKTIIEENENSPSKDCAIVTANLKIGDKTIGKVGVLGPVMMDYKNVISLLKGLANEISERLNKPYNKGE